MSQYSNPNDVTGNFARMLLGGPGAIEAQEREEQAKLVASADPAAGTLHLPLPGCKHARAAFLEAMKTLGIVYGDAIDDLFYSCVVPQGWALKGTDHAMWSKLLDDKGRERASVFYKGAFYDRVADIYLSRCVIAGDEPVGGYSQSVYGVTPVVGQVKFDDVVIAQTAPIEQTPGIGYVASDTARESAVAWLNANFPDNENPLAYWDNERPEGVAVIPVVGRKAESETDNA